MNKEQFLKAIDEVVKEKHIDREIIFEAMEHAMLSAYKKHFNQKEIVNARVEINRNTGMINIYSQKEIVEEVENIQTQLSLAQANNINPNYKLGDIYEEEVTPDDFGRIAAQSAKQVLIQKIREAERQSIFDEFSQLEGELVTGILSREDSKNYYVDLGRSHATLPKSEIIPGEKLVMGRSIEIFLSKVDNSGKFPLLLATRTSPQVLRKLLEKEIPEIQDGLVEVFNVVRDVGDRSKVAVMSMDETIDAIGSCIGPKGTRIRNIINSLGGEKLDIVEYSSDPAIFIENALSPAKVLMIKIIDPKNKEAIVVVSDDQLSLAIGKKGQNARLSARLTGWKIDLKSLEQAQEEGVF